MIPVSFGYIVFAVGLIVLVAVRLLYWNPRIANGTAHQTATGRNVKMTLLVVSFALTAFGLALSFASHH
jgi:hypothetical protein